MQWNTTPVVARVSVCADLSPHALPLKCVCETKSEIVANGLNSQSHPAHPSSINAQKSQE